MTTHKLQPGKRYTLRTYPDGRVENMGHKPVLIASLTERRPGLRQGRGWRLWNQFTDEAELYDFSTAQQLGPDMFIAEFIGIEGKDPAQV